MSSGLHADGNKQRKTLGALGILAALVLLVASMVMNFRFGYSLGKSPEDGLIYGAISAAADAFKALCPFFFFAAWRERQWAGAFASGAVWVVVVLYASAGAAGHAGANRLDTAGERTLAADHYKDLRAAQKRYDEQLKWLPAHRGADTVKADLEGIKGQLMWTQSTECTEPRGKQREFCQGYHKLNAELGNATKADEYTKKIEAIAAKLAETKGGAAASDADPQATIISRMLVFVGVNIALADTQTWLAIAVALVLELGSTFGLYIAVLYFSGTSEPKIEQLGHREPITSAVEQPKGQGQTEQISAVPLITHVTSPQQPSEEPAVPEPPTVLRARLPGSDDALKAIGIPFTGDRKGPLLDALPGRAAAEALVIWIQAHDLARTNLSSEQISAYDAECCQMRHRRQTLDSDVKEAMPHLRGRVVEKSRPKQPDGSRPYRYAIKPGKYPKPEPQAPAEPAERKQEGGKVYAFGRRPLAVAPRRGAPARVAANDTFSERVDEIAERRQMEIAA